MNKSLGTTCAPKSQLFAMLAILLHLMCHTHQPYLDQSSFGCSVRECNVVVGPLRPTNAPCFRQQTNDTVTFAPIPLGHYFSTQFPVSIQRNRRCNLPSMRFWHHFNSQFVSALTDSVLSQRLPPTKHQQFFFRRSLRPSIQQHITNAFRVYIANKTLALRLLVLLLLDGKNKTHITHPSVHM